MGDVITFNLWKAENKYATSFDAGLEYKTQYTLIPSQIRYYIGFRVWDEMSYE